MSKKLVSFNPTDALAIIGDMSRATGVVIPFKAVNEILIYLVENMDKNMAYVSSFWNMKALSNFAVSTGSLPTVMKLSEQQLKLVMDMLQPVGLALFGIIYRNNLFKDEGKDTFPYIVVDVNNGMIILEEDTL